MTDSNSSPFKSSINFDVNMISALSPKGIALHIACVWIWLAVTKKFKLLSIFKRLKTFSIALLISGNISLVTLTEVERS